MKAGSRTRPTLPPVAEGVYPFVCVGVIDMGEQESIWKGKTRYSDKVKLIFELPGETIEVDGEELPRQLSRNFTFSSSSKSALRQFVSSWLGRSFTDGEFSEFELFELLGKPGLLSVVHSEDGQYANVGGAMALARGMAAPSAKSAYLRFDTTEWEEELFAALPKKDKDILGKCYGVFGYTKEPLEDIAMYHFMKVDAVEKARNKILEKLRKSYSGSMMQYWSKIHWALEYPDQLHDSHEYD